MKEALSADASQEGLDAIRQDDISSQLLMDDAFKLVLAYCLCETDEMALSHFASVAKLVSEAEDGSRRLGYVTGAIQGNGVLPIGNNVGHQTWDTEQSTPMKEGLSGERAALTSGTGCARTLTYASMLEDCVHFFLQAFGLVPNTTGSRRL